MRKLTIAYRSIIFLLCAFCFGSCATILNSKMVEIEIITSEPTMMVNPKGDSIKYASISKYIDVRRRKDPVSISLYTDNDAKNIEIKSGLSATSFLLPPGIILDLKNERGYRYPKLVFIDMDDTSSTYSRSVPMSNKEDFRRNTIKLTPLKLIGFTNPALALSYERAITGNLSTQLSLSYLYSKPELNSAVDRFFNPRTKGFRVALEQRYYFNGKYGYGWYSSVEYDYMNKEFYDAREYTGGGLKSHRYIEEYKIHRQTHDFNAKIGYQTESGCFIIDMFFGLGMRYRIVSHSEFDYPDAAPYPHVLFFPSGDWVKYSITRNEGEYWTMNIPLNFKIGYRF